MGREGPKWRLSCGQAGSSGGGEGARRVWGLELEPEGWEAQEGSGVGEWGAASLLG